MVTESAFSTATSGVVPYLLISLALFSIGAVGVMVRKNVIIVLMCVELMLNAVNISFVAFSRMHGSLDGQVMVFFAMAVAAAEAAVGLSIVIAIFRGYRSTESVVASDLRL